MKPREPKSSAKHRSAEILNVLRSFGGQAVVNCFFAGPLFPIVAVFGLLWWTIGTAGLRILGLPVAPTRIERESTDAGHFIKAKSLIVEIFGLALVLFVLAAFWASAWSDLGWPKRRFPPLVMAAFLVAFLSSLSRTIVARDHKALRTVAFGVACFVVTAVTLSSIYGLLR